MQRYRRTNHISSISLKYLRNKEIRYVALFFIIFSLRICYYRDCVCYIVRKLITRHTIDTALTYFSSFCVPTFSAYRALPSEGRIRVFNTLKSEINGIILIRRPNGLSVRFSLPASKTPHTHAMPGCVRVAHTWARRVASRRVASASPLAERSRGGGGRIDGDGFFRRTIKLISFDSD